ncbi:MAG: hypothetical protein WA432_02970 [Candidatus Babeliaceae bacterium]
MKVRSLILCFISVSLYCMQENAEKNPFPIIKYPEKEFSILHQNLPQLLIKKMQYPKSSFFALSWDMINQASLNKDIKVSFQEYELLRNEFKQMRYLWQIGKKKSKKHKIKKIDKQQEVIVSEFDIASLMPYLQYSEKSLRGADGCPFYNILIQGRRTKIQSNISTLFSLYERYQKIQEFNPLLFTGQGIYYKPIYFAHNPPVYEEYFGVQYLAGTNQRDALSTVTSSINIPALCYGPRFRLDTTKVFNYDAARDSRVKEMAAYIKYLLDKKLRESKNYILEHIFSYIQPEDLLNHN